MKITQKKQSKCVVGLFFPEEIGKKKQHFNENSEAMVFFGVETVSYEEHTSWWFSKMFETTT